MPYALLDLYVIFDHPDDFPDAWVVRKQTVYPGGKVVPCEQPEAVTDSLDACRAAIPPGLACIGRMPGDVPSLVEAWI